MLEYLQFSNVEDFALCVENRDLLIKSTPVIEYCIAMIVVS